MIAASPLIPTQRLLIIDQQPLLFQPYSIQNKLCLILPIPGTGVPIFVLSKDVKNDHIWNQE